MKALHQMTNTDKGKLLADLFPDQTEAIVEDILNKCTIIREQQAEIKQSWDDSFTPFEFWYSLAAETEKTIKKFRSNLIRSSKVFGEQLFFGYLAIFTNDCIIKYAARQDKMPKFQKAVDLIFNP